MSPIFDPRDERPVAGGRLNRCSSRRLIGIMAASAQRRAREEALRDAPRPDETPDA